MLSFTVRMQFDGADHDKVAEALRHLTMASRQEPGCVNYVAHFVDGDPSTVLIYEQYLSQEALDHHRGTTHFHHHAIGGLYQMMKGREMETLVAVC